MIAPERAPGSGQDGGDAHDPAQSGKSRGKLFVFWLHRCPYWPLLANERGRVDRALGRAAAVVELAKGPAEAFGPLKAVLASISGAHVQYRVCSDALFETFL